MGFFNKRLYLALSLFLIGFLNLCAQEKPIKLSVGTLKTELKEEAISLGIEYVRSLDSIFSYQDIMMAGEHSLFQLSPEFNVQTGTADAFSSVTAKLSGIVMTFQDTTIAGIITPNTSRGFHTFPIAVGFETNDRFSIVNGIAEAGWVPWYQTVGNKKTPQFLKHTKFGFFVQGGYKFKVDTVNSKPMGGEIDESAETIANGIFRLKGSFGIDTKSLFEMGGVGVGLAGNAHGWYDMLNNEVYYTIEAKVRFYPSRQMDKSLDFEYQKGSGAPNFNQGDQFGIELTVTF